MENAANVKLAGCFLAGICDIRLMTSKTQPCLNNGLLYKQSGYTMCSEYRDFK